MALQVLRRLYKIFAKDDACNRFQDQVIASFDTVSSIAQGPRGPAGPRGPVGPQGPPAVYTGGTGLTTAFEKTWVKDFNNAWSDYSSQLAVAQSIVWWLKTFLLANGWTVYKSCDAVSVDTTDLWGVAFDASKIVRGAAGVAHSWFTLKSSLIGGAYYYYTLDFSGATDALSLNIAVSKGAPTGAVDVDHCPSGTYQWTQSALQVGLTADVGRVHGVITNDGTCWLIFAGRNTLAHAEVAMAFVKLEDTKITDEFPVTTWWAYSAGSRGPTTYQNFTTSWAGFGYTTTEGVVANKATVPLVDGSTYALSYISAAGDRIDGKYPDAPIDIYTVTSGKGSRRGRIPDIAWAPSTAPQAVTEPSDDNPRWTVVGDIWLPADEAPIF